ncbi:hypothetical protein VXQ42_00225 [Acinetobacter baumannii]|uniref:hypothetical protein n=1 Tax=Acinetobacter baumannii TaxID=470 RepID=UPI000A3AAF78|nr:hypothetical protein [Acinetobacter baumannii]ANS21475.1 hypothetical protein G424_09070 [Acinetobacter baumannii PR07]MBI1411603.1 hypothetical protein [Acinetobacter baumannii]MBI1432874.1 hypothetical protein [Acinetobacter baumannii]MDR9527324.1 hypothetical protein [Acinetobacter baumannii]MDV4240906.1 hypothetical protein [Acinetobacter baumannii]
MNQESLIKVETLEAESTGYLFLSHDEKKSFVITSKHSICDQKDNCAPYKNKEDGCCRTCPKEFTMENIHLLQEGSQEKLSISKIFCDKNKDLTIIEVNERATDKLIINEEIYTDSYIARGFNEKDNDWINLDLDKPKDFGSLIFYRHSSSNPNLVEKKDNFKGISGSVVFTYHQHHSQQIAKAIIIHNENHNDFGAENLEKLDFDYINTFFECHVFHRKKDIEVDELRCLLQKNQEWLLESFSNNKAAKHSFGQSLAPNDPNLPKLLPRESLINTIHHNLFSEDINFILGKEGVGKSWVTAQSWLLLEDKPLHVFLTAQDFSQLSKNDLESFLIKKILEQTNDEESEIAFKKWSERFKRWEIDSNKTDINLLVTIDGINQKPNVDWPLIINKISHLFEKKKVKILVTSRTIFFNEKVKRKIINNYGTVIVTDWSEDERNEILISKGINPSLLTDSVADSLLNPRLLNISLSLFEKQKIQKIDELDVNRILLEHIRQMESENYEEISYSEFLKSLQNHAQQIINRLVKDEKDDLNHFEGNLNAVAEGRFFEVVEDDLDSYKLRDEGLCFSLGLEIILQLNRMKRNGKNLDDGLAKIIEPINALDKTSDIIISSLTILIFEPNYYSREVLTALVSCFVSLQNTDESYLGYFATIVERKISDFINILEELCLNGGNQPNYNWIEKSIICIPHTSQSWPCIEEQIQKWLKYYSLSPEKKLSYFSKKDANDRLIAFEKYKIEISEKLNRLSTTEKRLITQLTENEKDIDTLVITAFHILAGKPLAKFAPEFIKWSFSCSLNSSYSSPNKEFINLIRYNLVDWENTRTQLLNEAQILNSSDTSDIAKWAYIRVLYSTGDSEDENIAEEIINKLRPNAHSGGWRRIEDYCSTDPCDPESFEPENIVNTTKKCEELDVNQIWNDLNQTSESLLLHDIETGMARFRSSEIISKYRKLITNILCRKQYPLRCGVINIDQHNVLFTKEHIDKLLNFHKLNKGFDIIDELSENDKNFVNQFLVMMCLPYIKPIHQLEILLNFKKENMVFINLIEIMTAVSSKEFNLVLDRKLSENQIFNLLCYVNIKKLKLNIKFREILKENILSHNSFIRTEVFKSILLYEDIELLNIFINTNWSVSSTDNNHELFYGSSLWLLSAKNNLIAEETAIINIDPCVFGVANKYLSKTGLRKLSYTIDYIFKSIIDTKINFPILEIFENLSLHERNASIFLIDRRENKINLEEHLKLLSESAGEFEKRQEDQKLEFKNYIDYLKSEGANILLNGMLPEEFSTILNSAPELKNQWFNIFYNLSKNYIPQFYNFILLLASAYSNSDPHKSQLLWDKIKNSESIINIIVGPEKIPLKQMSIWGSKNQGLNLYRFRILDQALSDEEIYSHVLAAIVNHNEAIIYDYINIKINCVEPSQIARGVLVAGCLDENSLSQEIFDKYKDYKGLIGEAYNASLYMYERNIWSKYWFKQMVSTENNEEFWKNMILFTKIVDSRFYTWNESILNKNILFDSFYQSFTNDIKNRCKKWQKERSKKLFGSEPPNSIYIYSE